MRHSTFAALAVAGTAAALALAGCSGGSPAGGATTGGAAAGGSPVTLSLWTGFTGGDRPGYEQIVADWNAAHPDIQVTMDVQSWDTIQTKLPAAWLTGSGPDIATPSSDPNAVGDYVKTNSVLPITATGDGADQINVSSFAPGLADEFTYGGKLYGVPANYATLSLYYNKDAFAAAGIANPPTTVQEFQDDAVKLTGGKTQYGLVLADNQTIQMWPILQWLSGGDIVDSKGCSVVQTAAGQQSLSTWAKLVTDKKISPVGLTGAQADDLFAAGKAAMEMNGPWAAPSYKKAGVNFGLAPIPAGVDGKSVTLGSTAPLAISAKTAHPKEAQEFLAYWTSKDVQEKFSVTTGFPPLRTDLASDSKITSDPTISVFNSQVGTSRMYLPRVPNATKVDSDGYVTLIGQITRGTDVATATAQAATTIDNLTGCKQ
ncbi:MAG: ABC transporter substrate-binding protein [Cellulomonas sp. 73-92]|uniref:ABC transporter substrate-binding protein n=1 Tax=Cellulomonas sp. 73-92 TaxID=1895740 RepID=UPI00092CAD58|nr:ABC transporter substrate-binding protein [Cellulomonas sp. 73-92]OJV76603.1 MAG: ABC transporter substrate-binding protein [Cellulomonas sp. 73-92]